MFKDKFQVVNYLDIKVKQKDWNKCDENKGKRQRNDEQDGDDLEAIPDGILERLRDLGFKDFDILAKAVDDSTNRRRLKELDVAFKD